jgi:hypothetical protein
LYARKLFPTKIQGTSTGNHMLGVTVNNFASVGCTIVNSNIYIIGITKEAIVFYVECLTAMVH